MTLLAAISETDQAIRIDCDPSPPVIIKALGVKCRVRW